MRSPSDETHLLIASDSSRVAAAPAERGRGDDKIKVVATIPDLADMTRQHRRRPRRGDEPLHRRGGHPRRADEAELRRHCSIAPTCSCCMGLEAEHAFLPALLEAARNPKILRDGPGYIDARCTSRRWRCRRASTARSAISTRWATRTSTSTPCSARTWRAPSPTGSRATTRSMRPTFKQNLDAYLAKLDAAIARWETRGGAAEGQEARQLPSRHDLLRRALRHGGGRHDRDPRRRRSDALATSTELEEKMRQREGRLRRARAALSRPGWRRRSRRRPARSWSSCPRWSAACRRRRTTSSFIDYNMRTMLKATGSAPG